MEYTAAKSHEYNNVRLGGGCSWSLVIILYENLKSIEREGNVRLFTLIYISSNGRSTRKDKKIVKHIISGTKAL